jgi:predicted DNA binding CopG/RHH family protein
MGRPPKKANEKYQAVHIRLHPQALAWAKAEAKKRGIGYQTVINETLLHQPPNRSWNPPRQSS